jgi:hypothetical protein
MNIQERSRLFFVKYTTPYGIHLSANYETLGRRALLQRPMITRLAKKFPVLCGPKFQHHVH